MKTKIEAFDFKKINEKKLGSDIPAAGQIMWSDNEENRSI
jgi:hypothetical protein